MIREESKHIGMFVFEIRNLENGEITEEVVYNRLVNNSLNTFVDSLVGPQTTDLEIKYLAVGTSDAPVNDTDTQLGAEIDRVQTTQAAARVSTGRVETEFILLKTDAIGAIKEIGIFCGSSATAAANSGTMHARILWDKNKTANEEIVIKRIDIISRG